MEGILPCQHETQCHLLVCCLAVRDVIWVCCLNEVTDVVTDQLMELDHGHLDASEHRLGDLNAQRPESLKCALELIKYLYKIFPLPDVINSTSYHHESTITHNKY